MRVLTMTGDEPFIHQGNSMLITVKDFWAWNSSNLLSNTLRGALAEYIVAKALNIDLTFARNDWTEFDLLYKDKRIEVKSSAYLQAWNQIHLSEIRFSIAPARSWTDEQHYDNTPARRSGLYVFCLYDHKELSSANPLCLDHWKFFILPTKTINNKLGNQKSISLKSLHKLDPVISDYTGIKDTIDQMNI